MREFDKIVQQISESLKITRGGEYSRAVFPEGEILFKEKTLNGTPYLEMHIQIKKKYQGKGHAAEKVKELINTLNAPAFFSHGRVLNDNVYKVLNKIGQDERFEVVEVENGIWVKLKR